MSKSNKKTRSISSFLSKTQTDLKYEAANKLPNKGVSVYLPAEVLVRIFSFYVKSHGHDNLLKYPGRVSQLWNAAALDYSLWLEVDATQSKHCFLSLCKKGQLSRTRELKLSSLGKHLSSKDLELIMKNCQKLKAIDLSCCENANAQVLISLPEYCPDLVQVIFSNIKNKYITTLSLTPLLNTCGANLTHIDLSENYISNFLNLMTLLAEFCHNLRALYLMNISGSKLIFPIESVQHGCPLLRELRLGSVSHFLSLSKKEQEVATGFPELEVYTSGINNGTGPSDDHLIRTLKTSTKLKILDLRGCEDITLFALLDLPATDLEYLYLSASKVLYSGSLHMVLPKWKHSLKLVDLSRSRFLDSINGAILSLIENSSNSPLEQLDLSNSSVTVYTLRQIKKKCARLHYLNLESCRSLPRGTKRIYHTEKELKELWIRIGNEHPT